MKVLDTDLPGVKVIELEKSKDDRGYKETTLNVKAMKENDIVFNCVQQNIYHAPEKGTFYGIHFQDKKHPHAKLIYCICGRGIDYIVDLRKDSLHYKQWIAIEIEGSDNYHIYIPHGYGHAFLTLEDNTKQLFSIDEYFYPNSSKQIRYDDNQINIKYPIPIKNISEYDKNAPYLDEINYEI